MQHKITVTANIHADIKKVWDYYTNPTHIVHWNFADPSWHCPAAENDLRVGGIYKARMEAKDGSFGFDFEVVYTDIIEHKEISYEFGGRTAHILFESSNDETQLTIRFDPENQNPIEMQQAGWQAILNNFKSYTENN